MLAVALRAALPVVSVTRLRMYVVWCLVIARRFGLARTGIRLSDLVLALGPFDGAWPTTSKFAAPTSPRNWQGQAGDTPLGPILPALPVFAFAFAHVCGHPLPHLLPDPPLTPLDPPIRSPVCPCGAPVHFVFCGGR
jgi:hypothetical protein